MGLPRRLGARAGSELLWAVLRYRRTDLYRIVSLRWPTGYSWSCWVVATAGQSYGLANSSAKTSARVVAGATLAVTAVFQLAPPAPHPAGGGPALQPAPCDAGQTTGTWLESERISSPKENR